MTRWLQLSTALLFGGFLVPGIPSFALGFDGALNPALFEPNKAEFINSVISPGADSYLTGYEQRIRKTLDDQHSFLVLYYNDLSTITGLTDQLTEAERSAEARLVARQALSAAIRDTVNNVNLLYSIKEYSRAVSSADLMVQGGQVNFEGPSLSKAGNQSQPSVHETFRSSLIMINNADFGVSLRTSMGTLLSRVTYFLAGDDILGVSLERELFQQTRLVLEYRVAPDENQSLATLRLPFRF